MSHGVLVLNANGSFSYTPTANFNGTDSSPTSCPTVTVAPIPAWSRSPSPR
ncbi:MAG: Ig-like domain-containing protein [Paracoccaceae bacterium]